MPATREGLDVPNAAGIAEADRLRPAPVVLARGWLPLLLPGGVLALLLVALYAPVMASLAALWRAEASYSQGLLIPVLAAYMVWYRRSELRGIRTRPCLAALPALMAGLLMLVAGRLAFEIHAAALSLIIVLASVVALAGGVQLLRAVWFPLAYLIFMIPLPWVVYFAAGDPLKTMTADLATALVRPLAIPLLQDGTFIRLPTVTLEVEAACSGIRTLLSVLPLAVACAYVMVRRPWAKFLLVGSAFPIAVLGNILRVTAIIVQAHLYPDWVTGYALHLYSTGIPMALGLPMLLGVGGLLQWWERRWDCGSPS